MITSKNGHFQNWSLRKMSHFENDHFKKWVISRNDHFKKSVGSKTITFKNRSLRKIDHFENDRFEERANSKTTTSKNRSLPKWAIRKIGNFGNSKKSHLERDHFGLGSLRKSLITKEGHFEKGLAIIIIDSSCAILNNRSNFDLECHSEILFLKQYRHH